MFYNMERFFLCYNKNVQKFNIYKFRHNKNNIFFLLTFGIILHSLAICFILIMEYVFDAFIYILKIIYKFFRFLI